MFFGHPRPVVPPKDDPCRMRRAVAALWGIAVPIFNVVRTREWGHISLDKSE